MSLNYRRNELLIESLEQALVKAEAANVWFNGSPVEDTLRAILTEAHREQETA